MDMQKLVAKVLAGSLLPEEAAKAFSLDIVHFSPAAAGFAREENNAFWKVYAIWSEQIRPGQEAANKVMQEQRNREQAQLRAKRDPDAGQWNEEGYDDDPAPQGGRLRHR